MPYLVNPPHVHWGSMLFTKLPGQESIFPTSVDVFPLHDCPPIRRVTPKVHPLHTIMLGQRQLRGLPNHSTICHRDFSQGPVMCRPSTGTVLISTSIRILILLHDELVAACRLSTLDNWKRVLAIITPSPSPPVSIPAEWTVQLATGDADLGSIIECINFENHHRFYSELQELIVSDSLESLFLARVLGYDHDPTCIVRIPNDFVEPYLISNIVRTDSIQTDVSFRLFQLLDQPNVAYILPSILSVALLVEKIVPSNLYDQHEDLLAVERERYVAETRLRTERSNSPGAISVNIVTEEFTDTQPVILNKNPRKRPASPAGAEEDRQKAKKRREEKKKRDSDKDF